MKKIISALAIACTCIVCPFDAKAESQSTELRPYLGADGGINLMPSDGGLIYSVHGGVKRGNFGLEIFYQGNNADNEKQITYSAEAAEFSSEHYSVGADILAYLPLFEKFDIFASLGYAMYFYEEEIDFGDLSLTRDIEHTEMAHGVRLAAGAMYEFFPNLSARLTARYTLVEMGKYETYSNPVGVTIGVRYTF